MQNGVVQQIISPTSVNYGHPTVNRQLASRGPICCPAVVPRIGRYSDMFSGRFYGP